MPKQLQFEDLKTAALGQTFERRELAIACKAVYGGVSWPGKRPGFAVVIAMNTSLHFENHDICLLAEFESFHMRDLVRQCGALDFKYGPKRWIGNWEHDAADCFIKEMNSEKERQQQRFSLNSTPMLDMEHFYQYALDEIRRLLKEDCRQLFLKESKVLNYLSEITEESEVATLELGDFPAIEALAFAVIEMRNYNFDLDYAGDYCADPYEHNVLEFGRDGGGAYSCGYAR